MGLKGYANYYQIQAKEEIYHATLIYRYMHNNDAKVELMIINANTKKPKGIKDALDIALEAEGEITSSINKIYQEADKINDYRTKVFLSWFIDEQIEEENSAKDMIEDYDLFSSNGLFDLDSKYQKREYRKTNMEIA